MSDKKPTSMTGKRTRAASTTVDMSTSTTTTTTITPTASPSPTCATVALSFTTGTPTAEDSVIDLHTRVAKQNNALRLLTEQVFAMATRLDDTISQNQARHDALVLQFTNRLEDMDRQHQAQIESMARQYRAHVADLQWQLNAQKDDAAQDLSMIHRRLYRLDRNRDLQMINSNDDSNGDHSDNSLDGTSNRRHDSVVRRMDVYDVEQRLDYGSRRMDDLEMLVDNVARRVSQMEDEEKMDIARESQARDDYYVRENEHIARRVDEAVVKAAVEHMEVDERFMDAEEDFSAEDQTEERHHAKYHRVNETTRKPVMAPVEVPVKAPRRAPVEAPVRVLRRASVKAPVEAPVEAPVKAPRRSPAKAPIMAPAEAPVETPIEAPVETPIEAPVMAPVEAPVEAPIMASVAAPVEAPVKAPRRVPAKVPVKAKVRTPPPPMATRKNKDRGKRKSIDHENYVTVSDISGPDSDSYDNDDDDDYKALSDEDYKEEGEESGGERWDIVGHESDGEIKEAGRENAGEDHEDDRDDGEDHEVDHDGGEDHEDDHDGGDYAFDADQPRTDIFTERAYNVLLDEVAALYYQPPPEELVGLERTWRLHTAVSSSLEDLWQRWVVSEQDRPSVWCAATVMAKRWRKNFNLTEQSAYYIQRRIISNVFKHLLAMGKEGTLEERVDKAMTIVEEEIDEVGSLYKYSRPPTKKSKGYAGSYAAIMAAKKRSNRPPRRRYRRSEQPPNK